MALYEVTLRSEYAGQQMVNRWNYVSAGETAAVLGSFALAAAFGAIPAGTPPALPTGTVFERIRNITVNACRMVELSVANVYVPSDFYLRPFGTGVVGLRAETGESPAVSVGYRTNRVTRAIGRGTKRFSGIPDTFAGAGGNLAAGILADVQLLADSMSAVLTYNDEGNTVSFSPAVVSKVEYTTPSGSTAYRYAPDLAAQLARTAVGVLWEFYPQVRTQTSRQYGRGS